MPSARTRAERERAHGRLDDLLERKLSHPAALGIRRHTLLGETAAALRDERIARGELSADGVGESPGEALAKLGLGSPECPGDERPSSAPSMASGPGPMARPA